MRRPQARTIRRSGEGWSAGAVGAARGGEPGPFGSEGAAFRYVAAGIRSGDGTRRRGEETRDGEDGTIEGIVGFPMIPSALALDVRSGPRGAVEDDGMREGERPDGQRVHRDEGRGGFPPELPRGAMAHET